MPLTIEKRHKPTYIQAIEDDEVCRAYFKHYDPKLEPHCDHTLKYGGVPKGKTKSKKSRQQVLGTCKPKRQSKGPSTTP